MAFWEPVVLLEEATPDPGDYHPEPEWYFLFLFQHLRLKMFSGEFGQFLGAMALPGALGVLLVALPFIDRDPERNIFKRPIALIGWMVRDGFDPAFHGVRDYQPRVFGLSVSAKLGRWISAL